MTRRLQFACIFLAAMLFPLIGISARAQQATSTAPAGPFHITGTIVNSASGKPLDRAVVSLETPGTDGHLLESVQTREDGHFGFEHLAPAKYSLRATRHGFITAGYDDHEEFSTAIVTGTGLDSENL